LEVRYLILGCAVRIAPYVSGHEERGSCWEAERRGDIGEGGGSEAPASPGTCREGVINEWMASVVVSA
jgi:hypothetical protein